LTDTDVPVPKKAIDASDRLKAIVLFSAGYEHVDVKAATEKGVYVVNNPDSNTVAVAEYTLGLMFTLIKKIISADKAVRRGKWNIRPTLRVSEFEGKTLGIIGLGHIGRTVATKAMGLGMNIIAYSPHIKEEIAKKIDVKLVDLETLLKESEIVSIHTVLTEDKRHLIGEHELRLMKRSAYLINTARGPIVDKGALYRALKESLIKGAALDVFDKEPPDPDDPLLKLDNVVLAPHVAWNTEETVQKTLSMIVEEVSRIMKGKIPKNLVNIELLKRKQ
jgi:D-3-phosphoglycerate dehydrogenase